MIAVLVGFLKTVWSKAGMYILAGLGIVTAILGAFAYVSRAGKTKARLEQARAQLEAMKEAKRIEARIDAMSARDARQRLRDRWGRR
ncbi:hypothetical protein HW532_20970 [Kaustia mangrovi]|uniref:Uncharacterized protein n=1 Tax=Kaustia mangrovi TaxID=2593653 RepID=A0A7S8HE31_9HYPH|nr:hypothetical protein [Kaustia mangrovi]QPC44953.1 hypothetical protein HW532_20970 [Kaustia mangrovi]